LEQTSKTYGHWSSSPLLGVCARVCQNVFSYTECVLLYRDTCLGTCARCSCAARTPCRGAGALDVSLPPFQARECLREQDPRTKKWQGRRPLSLNTRRSWLWRTSFSCRSDSVSCPPAPLRRPIPCSAFSLTPEHKPPAPLRRPCIHTHTHPVGRHRHSLTA
jgi:hypothetical protein